jgi:outer membrane protein OmpA-like peptidoglycan-associated protein
MPRADLTRLVATAKLLAAHPDVRVNIEGYPDRPGEDGLMAGIAAHRAKVGQAILVHSGVQESRINTSTPGLSDSPWLARTIRVTTVPPLPELERQ